MLELLKPPPLRTHAYIDLLLSKGEAVEEHTANYEIKHYSEINGIHMDHQQQHQTIYLFALTD